jgi:hypothetical protein
MTRQQTCDRWPKKVAPPTSAVNEQFLAVDLRLIQNLIRNGFLLSCFDSPGLPFAAFVAT